MTTEFEKNIADIWGQDGKTWLTRLPELVRKLADKWNFQEVEVFSNLTYSYVFKVQAESQTFILKVAPPSSRTEREIDWYRFQNGIGCPSMIKSDASLGALLLEEITPATTCKNLVWTGSDGEATQAIAEALLSLQHRSAGDAEFPHVREFLESLESLRTHVPEDLLGRTIGLLDQLTSDKSVDVVLHGDLHHDNVLNHNGRWITIDPHGYIGPRGFEVGAMMRNPYDEFPKGPIELILENRVAILSAMLPFTRKEIVEWSIIYTLIATAWSLDDHGEIPTEHIDIAKTLSHLMEE